MKCRIRCHNALKPFIDFSDLMHKWTSDEYEKSLKHGYFQLPNLEALFSVPHRRKAVFDASAT
uniref:Uncharacterized protein n=1 Tax=Cucumis melo TaxID=3656 RepID=A0A9I9EHQ2_CUCME